MMLFSVMCWAQGAQVIKSVTVRGNQNLNSAGILAAMKIKEGKPFSRADINTDEDSILNMGFFKDVKILTRDVSATEIDIFVEVQENPIVKEVRVTGNTVLNSQKITDIVLKYQAMDQVFNNRNSRPIRTDIEAAYSKEGYFVQLLALEPDVNSPSTLLVSVLEPVVGEIKLIGLSRTKPSTVQRFIKTKPGKTFSLNQWQRDLEELYGTQWFDKIEPTPPAPTDKPGVFNLNVDFSEAKTAQVGAGIALDPQSRLVGSLYYNDGNFRGMGHTVGINVSQATVGGGPSAELAFGNRFYDRHDTSLNAQVFSKVVYNFVGSGTDPFSSNGKDQFSERRTGGSLSFSRPIGKSNRASVGITAQNIRAISFSNDPNDEFVQQDGDLAYLQIGYDFDTRRPSQEPWSGQFARLQFEPGYTNISRIGGNVAADTQVLGSHTFLRTSFEYRQYWSRPLKEGEAFDKPRPVTAVRAKFSNITGTVPFFEQLFIGGSNSLRGYDNQRFWGNNSVLASFEYRHPIQKSFNLIGFMDVGSAWGGYGRLKDFTQSNTPDFHFGYGIGASFRTPLGPIRIDFAFNDRGGNKTHFQFGASF